MTIAQAGYRIAYVPDAQAAEAPSFSLEDELSRKVRIAAGGFQAMGRLKALLLPLPNLRLWWQYFSHRVLRWAVGPVLLPCAFVANVVLLSTGAAIFKVLFWAQLACYLLAGLGWLLEAKKLRFKLLFVPFYFVFMNVAVLLGLLRYLRGQQSVNWARARRADG
jgi:cellulose synthase/poly-beta-1,6-N-acetylglucosamine synthase-like glycosyltransferase